jgi:hypothetical protein
VPWSRELLNNNAMTIMRGHVKMTAEEIIDLYLHGRYLHKDPAKRAELEAFPAREAMHGEFLRAVQLLGHVYYIVRNVVAAVLDEPSVLLTPAPA